MPTVKAPKAPVKQTRSRGMRSKAVRIDFIKDAPLDLPGWCIRAERFHWPDGSSCLVLTKMYPNPRYGGKLTVYFMGYAPIIQIPWSVALPVLDALVLGVAPGWLASRREG